MAAAPLPDDEAARLTDLLSLELLDTPSDPRFDAIVQLAADLFDVPFATVAFLDADRQWFKATHGHNVRETPREQAFCAHTILRPAQPLVVEDALLDMRFADNPMVIGEPGIRFYSGAAIVSAGGYALGALSLIDTRPRALDARGRQRLAALAASVSALVDLHGKALALHRAAISDPVTGATNRAVFDRRLDQAVAEATTEHPAALLLVDLDRFKFVNDTHGHAAGDAVLRETAARLTAAAGLGDLVARYGGNSFAVLSPHIGGAAEAASLARRIEAALAGLGSVAPLEPWQAELPLMGVTASIGVALCPQDAPEQGELLRAAELALYRAKRAGGSMIDFAAETRFGERRRAATAAGALERDLLTAIAANETELWWQPYIALHSREVEGCEALLRWHRFGHGDVPPSMLLPLIEASGAILPLDEWVLARACQEAAAWPLPRSVSVNLSAHWFGQEDVEALVTRALRRSGLDSARLCVELTEHTLIANRHAAQERMRRLHGLGTKLALDDFGTGSSSLAYLQHFHFDTIKMDRAFVAPLGRDSRVEAVARAIVRMGHELGAEICAEGVETHDQLEFLETEGCDMAQGFLFGKPAPAALLDRMLVPARQAVLF